MVAKKAMLQTYTHAVMVTARRKHVLTKPPGSVPDLIAFNIKTDVKIHEHFYTANKNRNPFTRHITPSRDRNGENEYVRMDFLRAAAREVLGPNTELPKVNDNGQPEFLMLNKEIIRHVFPSYDLSCFTVFANFCANIPTYMEWMRGNQRLTNEEIIGLKQELGDLRQAAAALAALLENPVISELTNFPQRRKNQLRATLRHISVRKDFGRKVPFLHFINRVISANKTSRGIYTADLFVTTYQPSILTQKPQAELTPRKAMLLDQSAAQQQIARQSLPGEPSAEQISRSEVSSPNPRGRAKTRNTTKRGRREAAGQIGLALNQ